MSDSVPISLIDVTTGYKGKPVTRGINAHLAAGQLTCLLGPNGAGKSTLLKTLSTFIPPLAGEIRIDGVSLRNLSARQLARRLSVVLTERPAAQNMSVRELVEIGRSPYTSFFGTLSPADRQAVDRAIGAVGIGDLAHRNIATLSDGERQKALIAKALAQDTGIICLDEPTAFVDYPGKVDLMKLLYRIAHREGKIIFMSTHDVELAMQISDTIWLLDKRLGLNIGTPAQLADTGLFAAYFERPGLVFDPATMTFVIDKDI